MKIGEKLKKRRIECSYSISDIASILGVNVDEIRDIENDVKEPSLEQLSILSKIYMTSIDDLCLPVSRQNYYVKNKRFNKIELYMSFVFIVITLINFVLFAVPFERIFIENGFSYLCGYSEIFTGASTLYLPMLLINIALLISSSVFIFFNNRFEKCIEFVLLISLTVLTTIIFLELTNNSASDYYYAGSIAMMVVNYLALILNIVLFIFRKKVN